MKPSEGDWEFFLLTLKKKNTFNSPCCFLWGGYACTGQSLWKVGSHTSLISPLITLLAPPSLMCMLCIWRGTQWWGCIKQDMCLKSIEQRSPNWRPLCTKNSMSKQLLLFLHAATSAVLQSVVRDALGSHVYCPLSQKALYEDFWADNCPVHPCAQTGDNRSSGVAEWKALFTEGWGPLCQGLDSGFPS